MTFKIFMKIFDEIYSKVVVMKGDEEREILVMTRLNIRQLLESRINENFRAGNLEFVDGDPNTISLCIVGDCGMYFFV